MMYIERTSETEQFKFLPVQIASKLSWKNDFQDLFQKLISYFFTQKVVYYAYSHSCKTFSDMFLGNLSDTERIFMAQKWTVRATRKSC